MSQAGHSRRAGDRRLPRATRFRDGSVTYFAAWLLVLAFLVFSILFPIVRVLCEPDAAAFKTVFHGTRYLSVMGNSLLIALAATFASVAVGYLYAYAIVFAKVPGAAFFEKLPALHLITPPFVGGLAFILLLGRQGFITRTLLHLDVSLYGFPGLLLAETLCFFPMAYLILAQTLRGINPNLIEAARAMGASDFTVFRTVIFPLSVPGITTSALFIAVSVLSDFGNPLIVGGRFKVLAVEIYTQLTGWLNAGVSATLGIALLVPAVILFLLQNRLLRTQAARTVTVGGKAVRNAEESASAVVAGRVARVFLTVFCALIAFSVLAQFVAIVAGSVQKLWGIDREFTMAHLKAVGRYGRELKNTLLFALAASVLSVLIALCTSFFVHRTTAPLARTLDTLIQLPMAVPGSLFGLALSLCARTLRYRNATVLVLIAMTTGFMPFAYRSVTAQFAQISRTLDDASRSLGQKTMGVLVTVLAPLSLEGAFSGFMYTFARGIGTVSAVIFLVSFKTPLTSISILNLAEQGDWGKASALALALTLLTFAILVAGQGVARRLGKFSSAETANGAKTLNGAEE